MNGNRHQILLQLLLGDDLDDVLAQVDNPAVAARLSDHLWRGIDRTTAADLEREQVIDRLLDQRVVRPDGPYDIERDVLADAYRVGFRDGGNGR